MKKTLSDWMGKARDLEAAIGARVEGASQGISKSSRQPLEVVHAVVDAIAAELQPAGRGQQAFPYTHLRIVLRAASPKERAKLEVACEGPPTLETRIHERLAASRCSSPAPVVKMTFASTGKPDWEDPDFHVEMTRGTAVVPAAAPPPLAPVSLPAVARLTLTIDHGTTDQPSYTFSGGVVAIGRGTEVRQRDGRLLRTNHVAFVEGAGDVNGSVSRQHAHIESDGTEATYRLFDDAGAERTSVVRDGKGLRVPHGRGLRLRSGDVIGIGDARVRVTID